MKPVYSVFGAALLCILLAGCANSVIRATPTDLMADPGGKESFIVNASYDSAYRKSHEQLIACFQRKLGLFGSAQISVIADKTPKDAQLSLTLSSITGVRTLYTVVLAPAEAKTNVTIYGSSDKGPALMKAAMRDWLDDNGTACPGDPGFADRLEKK